ncbi:hypothetical protein [Rhizobium sp. BK377]|uniref:hypothetical protein n=1 Tax=Rhizobium sp. BK377 TaxID=2587058 RepID=UPI0016090A06|nr:hypothetical protein [Rhizobium sp. BK377]MBB3461078.1 hypothetical protein [Rhizobium sp. BK377]
MSSSDIYQASSNDRSHPADSTSSRPAERTAMTPFNVVLLSAIGIILGGAAVLNFSPFGSLGRYQLVTGTPGTGTAIRIDTTTGELSFCYGIGVRKPTCLPWEHDTQPFRQPPQAGQ